MAFEFQGQDLTIQNAVMQAIGAASMCWEHPEKGGIFNSNRAVEIGEKLLDFLQETILPDVDRGEYDIRKWYAR